MSSHKSKGGTSTSLSSLARVTVKSGGSFSGVYKVVSILFLAVLALQIYLLERLLNNGNPSQGLVAVEASPTTQTEKDKADNNDNPQEHLARLRAMAQEILSQHIYNDGINVTCDNPDPTNHQLFYNRIGKAGSSTIIQLFKTTKAPHVKLVESLLPSDRGSDEYMTTQGELELVQKIVGNPVVAWAANDTTTRRNIFVYHVFFINFTRYGLRPPVYMNLVRDPATRYASQYAFWKKLPDIGPLIQAHGATLDTCLNQQTHHSLGCPPLNYQTSYFCGHGPPCTDPVNDATFRQAVQHVVQDYALIGTLERLTEFQQLWVHMFPTLIHPRRVHKWTQGTTVVSNANQDNPYAHNNNKDNVEVLERIRAANVYDVVLYQVINQIMDARVTACLPA